MTAAQSLVLVGFFEQGSDPAAAPLIQMAAGSVPREGDRLLLEGKEWTVAKVTWAILELAGGGKSIPGPAGLAATVALWDPGTAEDRAELAKAEDHPEPNHCVATTPSENHRWETCTLEDPCPLCASNLELVASLADQALELEAAELAVAVATAHARGAASLATRLGAQEARANNEEKLGEARGELLQSWLDFDWKDAVRALGPNEFKRFGDLCTTTAKHLSIGRPK